MLSGFRVWGLGLAADSASPSSALRARTCEFLNETETETILGNWGL